MEMLQAKSRQHCQEQMIRAIISNVLWKLLKIYLVLLLGQIQNPRSLTYPKLWKIMEWTVEFMGKNQTQTCLGSVSSFDLTLLNTSDWSLKFNGWRQNVNEISPTFKSPINQYRWFQGFFIILLPGHDHYFMIFWGKRNILICFEIKCPLISK